MLNMKRFFIVAALMIMGMSAIADEGMWIPMLLGKNEADMQKAGMKISAKDIYDINHACLKDAVLLFNQGCTGEYVSNEGLFLTNHHCGYSYITSHSTVAHDYLTHGFWAMSKDEELPCPGLTATRLVRMEDVTEEVLAGVTENTTEADRNRIIEKNIEQITAKAVRGTHYKAIIKPFYYGNQYFMYVNEVFTDVRLVGAPPSNIGKFGGDTDNWMWPRHTGDFSMFRVYADNDNKPAPYSRYNKPYKPLRFMEISLKGVDEGDFTFVFGYPGTTKRYVTSDEVDLAANVENPIRIKMRDIRLNHYKAAMEQSPAQRLKYASRVASIANGWKKWQGETQGIERLKGVQQKKEQERVFQEWANDKTEYSEVLAQLGANYRNMSPIEVERVYFNEAVMASDFMNRAYKLWQLSNSGSDSVVAAKTAELLKENENYFKDFDEHTVVDKAIFVETMLACWEAGYAPYLEKKGKDKAGITKLLNEIYDNSLLTHRDKMDKLLKSYKMGDKKKLVSDPGVDLFNVAYYVCYTQEKNTLYTRSRQNINQFIDVFSLIVDGMINKS